MRSRSACCCLQRGALFSSLSVFDNVAQPVRELGKVPEDLLRDIVHAETGDGRARRASTRPKCRRRCPGGMIKRVGIARAIALEPELLFLDEPTAGLDPQASDEFVELISALHRALGLTVVMVTHDLDTMVALSTRVAVLADGACRSPRLWRKWLASIIRSSANIFSACAGAARLLVGAAARAPRKAAGRRRSKTRRSGPK